MTGKEAIIDKIRQDARQKANSTLEEGSKRAQEAISIAYNDARIYKEKNMAESYAERDEIVRRKITVANLEVKKMTLQAKKQIIDKAFEEAVGLIKADKDGYLALIKRMMRFAEDGDVVVIAEADKKLVSKDFIVKQAAEYGKKVTVSDEYGAFCGGLILRSENADKNLTLEEELNGVRRDYEPAIAEVLFGE